MDEVKIGYEISKERWEEVAENIAQVAPLIANWFKQQNFEGRGAEDAKEFMSNAQLAIVTLKYVAGYASDKCRFLSLG